MRTGGGADSVLQTTAFGLGWLVDGGKVYKTTRVIASTREDSQGERLTIERLRQLARWLSQPRPLHQLHDMSLPVIGVMSNPRIEPITDAPGEWCIVMEIESEQELPLDLPELSLSSTEPIAMNADVPLVGFYLPYPLYNDATLVEDLLRSDSPLLVGKWSKKAAEPALIGILADLSLELVMGAAGSLLAHLFLTTVLPRLAPQLRQARDLWVQRKLVMDIRKDVRLEDGTLLEIYLCPRRSDPIGGYKPETIANAISDAIDLARTHGRAPDGQVAKIRFAFHTKLDRYQPVALHFASGRVTHLIDG